MTTLAQITRPQVADAAMAAHFDSGGDWGIVADAMLDLLGDTYAHRRIDGLRETVKEQGIEVSRLAGSNALLKIEISQLRGQVKNELDINLFLRRELTEARQALLEAQKGANVA